MKSFLVTGLPRSRTAWLSVLLHDPAWHVSCEHEPSAHFRHLDDAVRYFSMGKETGWRVGAADHGLGWWAKELIEATDMRVLLVERPMPDVYASVCKMGLPPSVIDYLEELRDRENRVRSHPNVQCIPFDRLNDRGRVEAAWFHLLPGVPFDESRYRALSRLNIELSRETVAEILTRQPGIYRECAEFLKEQHHA